MWFTYSFGPTREILQALEEQQLLVRVLLVHDGEGGRTRGVVVSNRAWSDFQEYTGDLGELYQWVSTPAGPCFHAKAVFFVDRLQETATPSAVALGSFNFTEQGVRRSVETIGWVDEAAQRRRLWLQAWSILNDREHVKPLVWEDLGDTSRTPRPRIAALLAVEELLRFQAALDQMMAAWPKKGSAALGYQSRIFGKLEERWNRNRVSGNLNSELLYLPVGSGKTFIALRWMVQRLLDTRGV